MVDNSEISQLSEFIAAHMGLNFPENRWADLQKGIFSAAGELGFNDTASCIQWLLSSPLSKRQTEILASHLTVGETYFFRDRKIFELLENDVLPGIISSGKDERRLRIWSAGCATGEEPYSIAILLDRMAHALRGWDITILATDINPLFLQKASEGLYTEWSFRDTPVWSRERYFRKTKAGSFEILPQIKKMVTFSYINLAEDTYPSLLNNTNAMDIIFCRNVLMYFAQNLQKGVIQKFYRSLSDRGYLIVSPSETSHILFSQFKATGLSGVTFYQKQTTGTRDQGSGISQFPAPDLRPLTPASFPSAPDLRSPVFDLSLAPDLRPLLPASFPSAPDPRPLAPDFYAEALSFYEQGHYAEAETKLASLLTQKQGDPAAITLLSRVYANQGKLSEAIEICGKAILIDKLNPGNHYLLANVLQEQGKAKEAEVSLKRAIYIDQNFVLAHFAIGNLCRQQGRFKESEKYFENVLSLLNKYRKEDILPESEGMTAGRLKEIINIYLRR